MKKYNLLQPYYMSFYSEPLYRDVAKNWRGIGFFYLLILLLLAWFPVMVAFHYDIKKIVNKKLPPIIAQIPNITFQDGETKIDQTSPVTIKDPESQATLAVIDTSGKYKTLDDVRAYVLLTKDKLFVQTDTGPRIYNVENFGNRKITRAEIYKYTENFKNWAVTVFYPLLLFISLVYRLLIGLIFAAIGAIIYENVLKTGMNFQTIYRLSIVAMTPAIILATILEFTPISGHWLLILYAVITLAYLYFAMQSNKNYHSENTRTETIERRI